MSNSETHTDAPVTPATSERDAGALSDDPQVERALAFVRTLLEKMDMRADVSLAPDDGETPEGDLPEIRLEIEGPDSGRIIGKKGAVLDAIQYLTSRVAHRPSDPRRHISVDAEGYRARHEEQLSQMAKRLAQRVAKEGKVITFDPMTPRERRIVHQALRDIPAVRTESMGEEPHRRVQIIPAKRPARESRPEADSGGADTSAS